MAKKKEAPKAAAPKDNKISHLKEREARIQQRLANVQAKIKELE